jgi:hypothetical protein
MALDRQEGGAHYKNYEIQPVEFIEANGLGYCEGNVVKYVSRHHLKNGAEDIKKAIHYLELILELQYGTKSNVQSKSDNDGEPRSESPVCNCPECDSTGSALASTLWKFYTTGGR